LFRFDTVGAIAIDFHGNVASAVSSGGLLMKLPGRVGQVWDRFFHCVINNNKIVHCASIFLKAKKFCGIEIQ